MLIFIQGEPGQQGEPGLIVSIVNDLTVKIKKYNLKQLLQLCFIIYISCRVVEVYVSVYCTIVVYLALFLFVQRVAHSIGTHWCWFPKDWCSLSRQFFILQGKSFLNLVTVVSVDSNYKFLILHGVQHKSRHSPSTGSEGETNTLHLQ